jgi:hypothetical protein
MRVADDGEEECLNLKDLEAHKHNLLLFPIDGMDGSLKLKGEMNYQFPADVTCI